MTTAYESAENAGPKEQYERFRRLVGSSTDLLTVILRCHLLIEERIHAVISAGLRAYKRPADGRDWLPFATAARIAAAILGPDTRPEFWASISKFNQLRNAYSHHAEPKQADKLLHDLVDKYRHRFPSDNDTALVADLTTDKQKITAVKRVAGHLWVFLLLEAHFLELEKTRLQRLQENLPDTWWIR